MSFKTGIPGNDEGGRRGKAEEADEGIPEIQRRASRPKEVARTGGERK